jgi:predicted transcriptional regulator
LAVVLSAFLLISSGFVPAIPGSSESVLTGVQPGSFVFILFSLLDPFLTVTSTQPAPGVGGVAVQQEPTSSQVQSESSAASTATYSSPSSTVPPLAVVPRLWTDSARKRSRFQIYIEILELLRRGPLTPFEVAFYARLNHKKAKEYLKFLEQKGYIELVYEDGRRMWVLSTSGGSIVEKVRAIYGLFESDFPTRRAYA